MPRVLEAVSGTRDKHQIYISYHKSQYHKNEIETAYDFIVYEFSKTFRENQDLFFGKICLMKVKVTQSCLTLCDLVDYTVHGILQARILEWVAFPFFQPRD